MEILQHGPVVAATSCSVVDLHSSELMSEIGEVCLLARKQFFLTMIMSSFISVVQDTSFIYVKRQFYYITAL